MWHFLRNTSAIALGTACLATPCDLAFAQGTLALEEIVVTARRREENLMQVPLAISAVTASEIENAGMRNLIDLGKFTPGLFASVSGNGRTDRSATKLVFRGLSQASGLTFIDGAPYAGSKTPDVTDAERVEVLKGPQSAYFGRSTYSGAVNFVPRAPADSFQGRVSTEFSQFSGSNASLSLEGPIIGDKLGVRINASHYDTGGQYRNPLQGNMLGQEETNAINLYIRSQVTDALTISSFMSYSLDDDGTPTEAVMLARKFSPAPGFAVTSAPRGGELQCNLGGTGGPYYCGQLPTITTLLQNNPLIISVYDRTDALTRARLLEALPVFNSSTGVTEKYPSLFRTDWLQHFGLKRLTQHAHLKLDYETSTGWSLNSTTSWDRTKQQAITDQNYRDASQLPNPNYRGPTLTPTLPVVDYHPLNVTSIIHNESTELRVTSPSEERLRGVAGVSWLVIRNPGSGTLGFGIGPGTGTVTNTFNKSKTDTPAVFGAAYYDITQDLTLTAEGRYQWDGIYQQQLWPILVPATPLHRTYKSFSPRVSLDYKFAEGSLAYILFSRGYRPGGFNTALIGNPPAILAQLEAAGGKLSFEQEKLVNFEAGVKSTLLDGRLQTTLAIYTDKWSNGQIANSIFVIQPDGTFRNPVLTLNQGKVDLKGLEADARFAATEELTVSASLGYMDNTITSYVYFPDGNELRGSTVVNGNSLRQAPKWTWSLSPQYEGHLIGDWDWFARADWTHRGKYFIDNTNVAWTAPLDLFNARIGFTNEKIRLEGFVANLTNNKQITEAVSGACCHDIIGNNVTANAIRIGVPKKRTFGVKGSYEF